MRSDVDSPPHDKALVDGYAVIANSVSPHSELSVLEEVMAGSVPNVPVTAGSATRIMTGAPLPAQADAVVMVEQTQLTSHGRVRVTAARTAAGQNIMPRGASLRRGDVALRAGREIRAIEIGVLAEVGRSQVPVYTPPTVAVLSTGNELVPYDALPAAGQIRNSNGPMLEALVGCLGALVTNLGIARDDRAELTRLVRRGLAEDVLLLSGGVSAGVLDLVPEVLAAEGVEQVFHKVHLKPGKPIWFGVKRDPNRHKLVFGLPGNPVGSLVCFELLVRPAIVRLTGHPQLSNARRVGQLTSDFRHRGDRPTYHPARLHETDSLPDIELLAWKGSADLRTLADANCLACFPSGDHDHVRGQPISVLLLGG